MKTIVTPLDGSALAEQALPYVRLLAPLLGAGVVLLRVVTPAEQQSVLARYAAERGGAHAAETDWQREQRALDELSRFAEQYLAAQAAALRAQDLSVSTAVTAGHAPECIVEAANHRRETLIVMATHGYSGLRRWTLGSVADRVVHLSHAPVLLVRAGATAPGPPSLRRILVPLDGSPLAAQALPLAAELAASAGAELLLLQVLLPFTELVPALAPTGRMLQVPPDVLDAEREQARQYLASEAAATRPGLRVTPLVEFGYPAETILHEAERQRADVIVMATHGYSGLRRWVLGSVADKVLHAAHAPLLLVRAQDA